MPVEGTQSHAAPLHELLGHGQCYQMPLFQRQYKWQAEDQLTRLWEDISKLLDDEAETVFLGAVVLQVEQSGNSSRSTRYTTIDGQQRITSLFLLLSAIARLAEEKGFTDIAENVVNSFLFSPLHKEKGTIKLFPTFRDHAQMNAVIGAIATIKANKLSGIGDKDGFLIDAYKFFVDKIEVYISGSKNNQQALDTLMTCVLDRLEIVQIILTKDQDANEVFDRLNTGGLPLAVIDLVRNEMFQLVSGDYELAQSIYQEHWRPLEDSLEHALGDQDPKTRDKIIDSYFFPYLLAHRSDAKKNKILSELRSFWDEIFPSSEGEEKARLIIEHLDRFTGPYLALECGVRPSGVSDELWNQLRLLRAVPLPSVTYPFFLRLIDAAKSNDVSDVDAIACAKIVESFLVRRGLVGLEPTGLHAIFKKLWNKTKGDPSKVLKNIVSKTISFPDDDEIHEAVLERPFYGRRVAKFVAAEYEASLQAKGYEALKYLPDITLDHVMPQKWAGSWKSVISEERHDATLDLWGNVVPLSSPLNALKHASSYDHSKDILNDETLFKTARQLIQSFDEWGEQQILDRTKSLSAWAVKRWPK